MSKPTDEFSPNDRVLVSDQWPGTIVANDRYNMYEILLDSETTSHMYHFKYVVTLPEKFKRHEEYDEMS